MTIAQQVQPVSNPADDVFIMVCNSLSNSPNSPNTESRINTAEYLKTTENVKAPLHIVLDELVNKYTLNTEQENVFRHIATHSITRENTQPLKMYIAGRGGTGKSRVIECLKAWFEKRDELHQFCLCDFTGVAAKNIDGMTLHSALRLTSLKKKVTSKLELELNSIWGGIDYLFIDKVSMISCEFLLDISNALSIARNDPREFGGINIIFKGDFCQLSPVGGTPLYSCQLFLTKKLQTSLKEKNLKKLSG